jgi:hypothetical protein
MNRNRRFPAVAVAAMLTAALVLTVAAPALGHHRPTHGADKSPAPTPLATVSPKPTATPAPTPSVQTTATPDVTPTPEPEPTPVLTPDPTPSPSGYPVVYTDAYLMWLAIFPEGVAEHCDLAWAMNPDPNQTCSATWVLLYLYPDGTWGACPWYADPTEPNGWSVDWTCNDFEGF